MSDTKPVGVDEDVVSVSLGSSTNRNSVGENVGNGRDNSAGDVLSDSRRLPNVGRRQLVGLGIFVTLVAATTQVFLALSADNLMFVGLAILSWPVALYTFISSQGFARHPLPSVLATGFWLTQIILPIVATALDGNPATYNLVVPEQVVIHNGLIFIALVSVWELHRQTYFPNGPIAKNTRRYLKKLGVLQTAPPLFLYLLGLVGISAMLFIHVILPSSDTVATGPIHKVIEGLTPMTYAPFLLFFGKLYGSNTDWKTHLGPLGVFTVLLLLIAVGQNSRASFMTAGMFVALAYGVGVMSGAYRTRVIKGWVLGVTLLIGYLLTGPLSDLATAMVVVRSERGEVQRDELIRLTVEAFQDKARLHEYRVNVEDAATETEWDERYLDNPFLSRFCNLKFADLSLQLAGKFDSKTGQAFRHITFQKLLATYPTPLVRLVGLPVDKAVVTSGSHGDFLYDLTGGGGVGSFRVGHIAGTGMAAFGWWYLPILALGLLIVFKLLQALTPNYRAPGGTPRFTPLSLLYLSSVFLFLPPESVVMVWAFIFRGWLQMIFLYGCLWIVYRFMVGSDRSDGKITRKASVPLRESANTKLV